MRSRLFAVAAAALVMAGAGGAAAADNSALMATINGFDNAFNTGKPIDAYLAPGSQSVIDDFAPHHWSGPGAIKAWGADFAAYAKRSGLTEGVVKVRAPSHVQQDAAHAYVVVPATFTFKLKGAPQHEDGAMTVALDRYRSGWKIAAFAWSAGVRP